MSTRSTTHFVSGYENKKKPLAIIYRHSDGYPEGAGTDIFWFFEDVKAQTNDARFDDPSYLAAKYVVWLARQYATEWKRDPNGRMKILSHANERPMDFISVGVCMKDPGDIEYRYIVDCNELKDGVPVVYCESPDGKVNYSIPRPKKENED